jgi:serine/threonine protein kinase
VKPSNLLVRDHDLRLIDFGIARYVGQPCGGNGIVECSRGWAAPEQLRAAPATPAVDIFAWGCLMAYLSAGVHPFASSSDQEWILRMQSAEPDLSGVPPGLADMTRATLARSPLDRPSAPELVTFCLANRNRTAHTVAVKPYTVSVPDGWRPFSYPNWSDGVPVVVSGCRGPGVGRPYDYGEATAGTSGNGGSVCRPDVTRIVAPA